MSVYVGVGGVVLDSQDLRIADVDLVTAPIGGEEALKCRPTIRKFKSSKNKLKLKYIYQAVDRKVVHEVVAI